ncbi:hypothetical protein [Candidatus Tisiphia endosymbiont of Sialis lutaria]|uniref:hypothetical protein n=1 Tax=Candidatus Tisiphia endosymbiont of Sialis lutaria TaxID=2029164 RepID=UPI00312C871F
MDHSSVEAEESLWSEGSWVESVFLGKCYDIVNSGEVGDVVTSRRLPTITN